MGKKNKKKNQVLVGETAVENTDANATAENLVVEAEADKQEKVQPEQAPVKEDVKKTDTGSKKKKVKKEKKESKPARRFKETGSELKKVTWPTFKETVKKTGVVLGVVIFFGLILFAFDYILTVLSSLLAGKSITAVQQWLSVGLACAIVVIAVVWIIVWAVRKKNRDRR